MAENSVTTTPEGPDLWAITIRLDGTVWTSWQWGEEARDRAEKLAAFMLAAPLLAAREVPTRRDPRQLYLPEMEPSCMS